MGWTTRILIGCSLLLGASDTSCGPGGSLSLDAGNPPNDAAADGENACSTPIDCAVDAGRDVENVNVDACPVVDCPRLQCANGVLTDGNGCGPCQCAPTLEAGFDTGLEAGPSGCHQDADCPTGDRCGFDEAEGCAATVGACFPARNIACLVYSPGCACDGSEMDIACNGLPSGYAPKPLLHKGMCGDGSL